MHISFTRLGICLLFSLSVLTSTAQDGSIDASFGTNGRVLDPTGSYELYPRMIVLPDGSILHFSNTGTGMQIIKYTPSGAIDGTFGVKTYNLPGFPRNVWLQPDGKIVAVGSHAGAATLIRLLADGSFDNSFDGDGRASVPIGTGASAGVDLVVQGDGKIVLAAQAFAGDDPVYAAARFHSSGSLDPSFDGDGIAIVNVNTGQGPQNIKTENVYTLALQPDGKLVLGGDVTNYVSTGPSFVYAQNIAAIRLNSDGTRDNTFAASGLYTEQNYLVQSKIVDAQVLPNGKIVLGIDGRMQDYFYANINRLHPDGTVDVSMGSQVGGDYRGGVADLALQADGKILISGWYDCFYCSDNEGDNFYVRRYLANGTPDSSFVSPRSGYGSNPLSPTGNTTTTSEEGGALVSQASNLLVGGYAVVRSFNSSTGAVTEEKATIFRVINSSPIVPEWSANTQGYVTVPARLQAEAYTAMSGIQTEPTTDTGGGQNVGYIDAGDWMEYQIAVPASGNYALSFRVSSPGYAFFNVTLNGTPLLSTDIPNTGGWQAWTIVIRQVNLPQGNHTIRLTSGNGAGWNINWFEVSPLGTSPDPNYVRLPSKIEAETAMTYNGVQFENTTDVGGGQNVGYIDQGDYLDFNVGPLASQYTVTFRVASAMSGGSFEVRREDGMVLATVQVPNTGGWQNWVNVSTAITLQPFNQRIRLLSTSTANWNINWLEFATGSNPPPPSYVAIPARIEAENYGAHNGTQTETTTDVGGGQNIGYIDPGDWMDYNIQTSGGTFTLHARVASAMAGGQFQVRTAEGTVLATFDVPDTGGWQSWVTVSGTITLPQGTQTVRVISTGSSYWNINWLQFAEPSVYVTIPALLEAEEYTAMSGTQAEPTTDAGGGHNLGYIDQGDWMEYKIAVPSAGSYGLALRLASPYTTARIEVLVDGASLTQFFVTNSGDWQAWYTHNLQLNLTAGNHTVRILSVGTGHWNINWLRFTAPATTARLQSGSMVFAEKKRESVELFPNPVQSGMTLSIDRDQKGRLQVEILGLGGNVVRKWNVAKESGKSQHLLDLQGLTPGQYLVRLSMNGWTQTKKIIKQ